MFGLGLGLEIPDQSLDRVNSTKDTANNTQEESQSTEGEFIPRLVTDTSQLEITQDGQKEYETTVGKSTNQAHEIVKEGNESSEDNKDDHGTGTDETTETPASKSTKTLIGDTSPLLEFKRKGGCVDGDGKNNVDGHYDHGKHLASRTARQGIVNGTSSLSTKWPVARNSS